MNDEISRIRRVFLTRLEVLSHVLDLGAAHITDETALLRSRLAPDMFPFGTQVAFACNQPRGFAQWCAGEAVQNLDREVASLAQARAHIADTRARVEAIAVDDRKLDETKRVGLGPGLHADLPGRRYVDDYLIPNLYFHIATAYLILRNAGVAIGKADFMTQLAGDVRHAPGAG